MFTLPEARGRGLAQAILKRSFSYGREEAAKSGKHFVASIVVDADNLPAKTLYENSGFVAVTEEPHDPSSTRKPLLMKYPPSLTDVVVTATAQG